MKKNAPLTAIVLFYLTACQSYDFIFQPASDRQAARLDFTVQQPSKADILFVIDNSGSMFEEQAALQNAINRLLTELAPQDTDYRLGIISTDVDGFSQDCGGDPLEPNSAKGNCVRPEVKLRRKHDGTQGRLIAAYDPNVFSGIADYLTTDPRDPTKPFPNDATYKQKDKLLSRFPSSATAGPATKGPLGEIGARWIIDRTAIRTEACGVCGCTVCEANDACFENCAEVIAPKLVEAYFRSNVSGLGISGLGYEAGIQAALLAVGIDATDPNSATAIEFSGSTLDGINLYIKNAGTKDETSERWIRDDAFLAIMFVSDEEDCSMSTGLKLSRAGYEEAAGQPLGSICYQDIAESDMLDVEYMANLLVRRKGGFRSRVAIGFIGGVKKTGDLGKESRQGTPGDCTVQNNLSTENCSCLSGVDDTRWCSFSIKPDQSLPKCEALASSRYVNFANRFRRKTFETICQPTTAGFGDALADFARIATLACFDLEGVRPVGNLSSNITVRRLASEQAAIGGTPTALELRDRDSIEPGWYYDDLEYRVCLTGLDRLIGDVYEIFVFHQDRVNPNQ